MGLGQPSGPIDRARVGGRGLNRHLVSMRNTYLDIFSYKGPNFGPQKPPDPQNIEYLHKKYVPQIIKQITNFRGISLFFLESNIKIQGYFEFFALVSSNSMWRKYPFFGPSLEPKISKNDPHSPPGGQISTLTPLINGPPKDPQWTP